MVLNGFRGFVRRNRLELFILRLPKVVNITFCLVAKCKFSNTTNHSIYATSVSHRWPFRCLFRLHVMTLEMVTDLWSWNSPQKLSKHSCQSKSLSMVLLILRVFCDVHFNTETFTCNKTIVHEVISLQGSSKIPFVKLDKHNIKTLCSLNLGFLTRDTCF